MSLKIAICDDIAADIQFLVSLIHAEAGSYDCTVYDSGEALLWDFESGFHFDIFFLDIYMDGINGVDVAKRIRAANLDALIIFVTSSNDFYRESYELYAFNYLIKPLTRHKLKEVLYRATAKLNMDTDQMIHFSFDNRLHTINCSQLLYLTSDKHIIWFHMINGKMLKSYGKIDDFVTQLPAKIFLRCHQSYIVNLKHVTGKTANEFMLGEEKVPISRKYSAQSRDNYHLQMFGDF